MNQKIQVKLYLGVIDNGEIRKLRIESFDELIGKTMKFVESSEISKDDLLFKYCDNDDDWITCDSSEDWNILLDDDELCKGTVKVMVSLKSIAKSIPSNIIAHPCPWRSHPRFNCMRRMEHCNEERRKKRKERRELKIQKMMKCLEEKSSDESSGGFSEEDPGLKKVWKKMLKLEKHGDAEGKSCKKKLKLWKKMSGMMHDLKSDMGHDESKKIRKQNRRKLKKFQRLRNQACADLYFSEDNQKLVSEKQPQKDQHQETSAGFEQSSPEDREPTFDSKSLTPQEAELNDKLMAMGFLNQRENLDTLRKTQCDLKSTVEHLLLCSSE